MIYINDLDNNLQNCLLKFAGDIQALWICYYYWRSAFNAKWPRVSYGHGHW